MFNLKQERFEARLDILKLAKLSGVSGAHIINHETGWKPMSASELASVKSVIEREKIIFKKSLEELENHGEENDE
jgi:hypothetical protein